MRFSNILLVLESVPGRTQAVRRALALAHNEHAALTVCEVVDRVPANRLRTITAVTPWEMMDSVIAEKFASLEKFIRSFETKYLPINIKVLVGKPHVEIARQVQTNHYDLVIKPASRRGNDSSGSAKKEDRDLMRSCPCPVWLVSAQDQHDNGPILAALDMPSEGKTSAGLNEHILEVSRSIALAEFRRLHIVHAWNLMEESHMRMRGNAATLLELERMMLRESAKRMNWLEKTVKAAKSDSQQIATEYLAPELHLIKGSPVKVVPDLTQQLEIGLIVMGTAARKGMAGIWLGNTSEKVLEHLDCSLLIVREPDPLSVATGTRKARQQFHISREGLHKLPIVGV